MAKKLEIKDNYLIVTDTVSGLETPYPAIKIRYNIYSSQLHLIYMDDNQDNQTYNLSDLVDFNGDAWGSTDLLRDWLNKNTGSIEGAVNLASNDMGRTAWGVPKVSLDNSIFHGMFTYNVPVTTWGESINDVVQSSFTNATSEDGKLNLVAGATLNDTTYLRTFRNPRYEPNRGYYYALSAFMPNPTDDGTRRWGYFTAESGAFFELTSTGLYAVVRTTVSTVTSDDRYLINTTGIDLSKGNLFDIQMQWRGVGNYFFYINQTLVKKISYLTTRTELTMFNPANPIAFECENLGDNVAIVCGCVDITSEGGKDNGKTYGSIGLNNDTGQVGIPGGSSFNTPVLAVRSKATVGGLINTRDTLALLATAYADQRCLLRIWATRDFTAITDNDQTWSDFGDGHLEKVIYDLEPDGSALVGTPMTFDTSKAELIFGSRVDQDQAYSTSALFEGRAEIFQTPSDMFIFTIHRENGGTANVGVTYEFAEEI